MDDMVPLKNGGLLPFLEVNQALQAIRRVEIKKPELLEELLHYMSRSDDDLRRKLLRELHDISESIYFFVWDEEKDKYVLYSQMRQVLRSALEEKDGQVFIEDPVERKTNW